MSSPQFCVYPNAIFLTMALKKPIDGSTDAKPVPGENPCTGDAGFAAFGKICAPAARRCHPGLWELLAIGAGLIGIQAELSPGCEIGVEDAPGQGV